MLGSEVCSRSLTTIPPRAPISRPQPRASSSRGLMPVQTTTIWQSIVRGVPSVASFTSMPQTAPFSSATSLCVDTPDSMLISRGASASPSIFSLSSLLPKGSSLIIEGNQYNGGGLYIKEPKFVKWSKGGVKFPPAQNRGK